MQTKKRAKPVKFGKAARDQEKKVAVPEVEATPAEPAEPVSTDKTIELPPKKVEEEEKPMSEFARRRKEMEERRAAKQKELDQIKLGESFC